jgi:ATP-binding cassette subfamily B protein/subfamily B ATP-binding cassette protein MsbA
MIEILRAMWPYLRPYRVTLGLALAAMVGETITALLAPWPLKFVFDWVLIVRHHHGHAQFRVALGSAQWTMLAIITGIAIVIAAADAALTYFDGQLSEVASQKAVYELRRTLFGHLQRLSIAFHQSADTRLGDLLSRLSGDIGALQDLAADGVSNIVTNGLTLASVAVVLFWLDWPTGIAAVLLTVPMALYTNHNTKTMRQAMRTARRQEGRVSAVLQESLSYIKLVQAYGREEQEAKRLSRASDRSLDANIRAATLLARLTPSVSFMSSVGYALLIVLGVDRVVSGHLTTGELLVVLSYVRTAQSPIRQLAKLSYSVSKAGASLERIREVLNLEPTIRERPSAARLRLSGPASVEFRDVTFGYSRERPVLEHISLRIAPGELIAVVGATGSGKSTLLSLLPRFYDPWAGAVCIAGHDVRDLTLRSLRASIGLVLQDSLIFRTTVLDNIAYGRPDASDAEVIAAAEASGAAMVAARLEDGYHTIVSERGASLSGGEKQCIGIARAMLKDAPIVVLDEPTSAMDAHTERLVMAGIARLLRNRTGFIIAHRLATVMRADHVVVLDEGRIVEYGSPELLLADPGSRFASLAKAQLITSPEADVLATGRHSRMAAPSGPAPPGPPRFQPLGPAPLPVPADVPHGGTTRAPGLRGGRWPFHTRPALTPTPPASQVQYARPYPDIPLREAIQAGHGEGFALGATVAREAPAHWQEAALARKPRIPSELQDRLLQRSGLPIEWLQHDDVRLALQQGFWDGLESSRW